MTALEWEEVSLGKIHDRNAFHCGEDHLDTYLKRYARQNHESGGAKCFVAAARDAPTRVLGFYTLSPASIEFARAPAVATRGLGRYEVPVYRLGRLAVDRSVQGRGLGGRLLLRAAERCMAVAQQVGGVALLIDAKTEMVAEWVRKLRGTTSPRCAALAHPALRRGGRSGEARGAMMLSNVTYARRMRPFFLIQVEVDYSEVLI
ncbi:GNAT family N-acetyltransferase [Methylosinus trichosporium]|uniref:GNAT family N-acetyltransferase n=1 Tax=Methylosinus trichosporium TaxID=426 RepID=UPI0024BA5E3A|nr:GNAT family N-acetyltransferase [Methylosinus trichosporium]